MTWSGPIRPCGPSDVEEVLRVVNDGAQAYRGVIPDASWRDPYMPAEELREELDAGVEMWGHYEGERLVAVMGLQELEEVTLIRHAYVASSHQRRGIGSRLLRDLLARTSGPVLVGTWADAAWAVAFYEKHGFRKVSTAARDRLLERYWRVPADHAAASVVLADEVARQRFVLA